MQLATRITGSGGAVRVIRRSLREAGPCRARQIDMILTRFAQIVQENQQNNGTGLKQFHNTTANFAQCPIGY
jgi:hypothetical protein